MAVRAIVAREEEKRKLRQTLEQRRFVTRQLGESTQSLAGKGTVIPERKVPPYRGTVVNDQLAFKKQVSLPLTCTSSAMDIIMLQKLNFPT
jgi:hypothetical protein